MGEAMINNLHDLYIHQLQDLYSAEKQILDALPTMIAKAQSSDLKEAFSHHEKETREHLTRVTSLLKNHGASAGTETCQAIKGLIEEAEHLMGELNRDAVDPGLVTSAQRVEHYEMAAYGTTKEFAKQLDYDDDVKVLDETLDEESNANEKLTKIATGGLFKSGVNKEAVAS
jgi:ferritin-like metal-binding protein YciE